MKINKIMPNEDLKLLHIFLTTACNLRCIMCSAKDKLNISPPLILDENILLDLSKQIDQPIMMRFTGGEPLVYFQDRLAVLEQLVGNENIFISFITNGLLLSEELLSILSHAQRGYQINFSIDGYLNIYEQIRKGAQWDKIVETLRMLEIKKNENNNIDIIIKYLIFNKTTDGYYDFVNFILKNNFSISYIEPGKLLMDSAFVNKTLMLNQEDYIKYNENLERIKNNFDVFVNNLGDIIINTQPSWVHQFHKPDFKASMCSFPFYSLSIYYDGSINPCCNSTNVVLGNLYKKKLYDIWNDSLIQSMRNNLLEKRKPAVCLCQAVTMNRRLIDDKQFSQEEDIIPNISEKRKKYLNSITEQAQKVSNIQEKVKFLESSKIYINDKYSVPIYSQLAAAYLYRIKDYNKADYYCNIILNIYPEHYETLIKKAIVAFNTNNTQVATDCIEHQVLTQDREHNIAYFWLAYFYEKINFTKAKSFYEKYIIAEKNEETWGYQHAKEWLSYYEYNV